MVDSRENGSGSSSSDRPVVQVNIFGRTDVGMVREHNEDNFLVADLSQKNRSLQAEVQNHTIGPLGSVFAVCDGMGGAAAGEVASKIGVDTIYEMMQLENAPASDEDLARRMNVAVCEAGSRIYNESKSNSAHRGMGTTATVAVLRSDRLLFGQVGDSRAHIIRNGKLVQTTKDQSLVQQLIDANQLTVEEAKNFDRSNIILQALGTSEEVHVDITSVLLRKGDILVICSDGLSGMVEPEDIRDVVLSMSSPMEACQKLTQMACDNGGDDNITVIVAQFDGEGLLPAAAGDIVQYEKYILAESDDDDDATTSIRSGLANTPVVGGSSPREREKKTMAQRLPMLVLMTALAMIGLVVGFSLSKKHDSDTATADTIPPKVTPASGIDSDEKNVDSASVQDTDLKPQDGDKVGNDHEKTAADVSHADSTAADQTPGDTEQSDEVDTMSDEDSALDDTAASASLAGGEDTEMDSGDESRSEDGGGASAEQDTADGSGSSVGKWSRVKSDRKRLSEDEKVSGANNDSEQSSTVEKNPY